MAPPAYSSAKAYSALKTLLGYTLMMITLPITMYFVSCHVLEGILKWHHKDSYIYAAAVAVLTVHLILGLFVYAAYKEPFDDEVPQQVTAKKSD